MSAIDNRTAKKRSRTDSIDSMNSVPSVSERVTRSRSNSIESRVVVPAKKRKASRPASRALVEIIELSENENGESAAIQSPAVIESNESENIVIDLSDTLNALVDADESHIDVRASANILQPTIPFRSTKKRTGRSRTSSVDSVSSVRSTSAGDALIVQFENSQPMRTRSRANSNASTNSVPSVSGRTPRSRSNSVESSTVVPAIAKKDQRVE